MRPCKQTNLEGKGVCAPILIFVEQVPIGLLVDVRHEGLHPDFGHFEVHQEVDKIETGPLFSERWPDQPAQRLESVDDSEIDTPIQP